MKYILVGDIGGTNPRLAMLEVLNKDSINIKKITNINTNLNSIIIPINNFLEDCSNLGMNTDTACFCVAGPVENNSCIKLTNSKFSISDTEILDKTMLKKLLVINDFEAIAEAIGNMSIQNELSKGVLKEILNVNARSVQVFSHKNRAVIGPGTSLGIAYLINTKLNSPSPNFIISSSEGGHASIPAVKGFEDLYIFLRKKIGYTHLATSTLVSGKGIMYIMEYFLHSPEVFSLFLKKNPRFTSSIGDILEINLGQSDSDNIFRKAFEGLEKGITTIDIPKMISESVYLNYKAMVSMKVFFEVLGITAQDLALNGLAEGGLFIAGGIIPKNKSLFFASNDFRRGFDHNYKESDLLKKIPIYLIDNYDISFIGAAIAASKRYKFNEI